MTIPDPASPLLGQPLIEVQDLQLHFPVKRGVLIQRQVAAVKAVDGLSFTIHDGETFGLVGESGCGKTTAGRAILQLYRPTAGHVWLHPRPSGGEDGIPALAEGSVDLTTLRGRRLRQVRRRIQMIFQDPYASLNPRMTVGGIVAEALTIHGLHKHQRRQRVAQLLDTVGISPALANRFPHEFSGGQRQRVGIARALAVEPWFVVADEPLSALDVSIQAQIVNLLQELQDRFRLTYLFISHDLAVVRAVSHRVAVMYLGQIVELAPSDALYREPLHPYTQALLSAVPIPDPAVERRRDRVILTGDIPSPLDPPPACRFHNRCPIAIDICREQDPEWRELRPGHYVACHRAQENLI
ncbi:MAG: ABC transporter ATP-binding protein [Chloroflexi bacterium]|nr:ABC transporter ATP-binding protein [Chloroflexota bacterium]